MSLKYVDVLFNQASCEYVDIIQQIVNKITYFNTKGENEKMLFAFNM